jgi:orotate phosphoribosyltransferase
MNLFQSGDFTLHSGEKSNFKIDCDALTDADIEALALMMAMRLPRYEKVIGVPSGGLRIAKALERYESIFGSLLIVDDVYTTGASMENKLTEIRQEDRECPVIGAVIFARRPTPAWITPLFVMSKEV